MDDAKLLVVAMVELCREKLQNSPESDSDLPSPLLPRHLLWMCDRIENCARDWPDTKLHRWLGFVQCGMMANKILDFEEAKALFDKAKIAHDGTANDDLNDHLDPDSSFNLEIGGQG
jgi:hypothetical protein